MKKMRGDIIILHMCAKNYDQMMMRDRRTDRRTDGQKKWHTEVGAPPKNIGLKSKDPLTLCKNHQIVTLKILQPKLPIY